MAHLFQQAKSATANVRMAHTNPSASPASSLQERARVERSFINTESTLPDLKKDPRTDENHSFSNDLLSYLGPWNPFPKPVTATDTVWLLDNTAYRLVNKNGQVGAWQAEFIAAVFDQNSGGHLSVVVADIAEKLRIGKGDKAEATIAKRLMPFVQDILPSKVIDTEFGGKDVLRLGPGGRSGISSDLKTLPPHNGGEVIDSVAKVPKGVNGILEMKTFYAEPEGWAVISDIDDTIKITQTSDPIGILRSTFVSEAEPVPGMPELYSYIQSLITPSSPFFYLSASPYNLYFFLHEFRQKFYPQGTMILREASWRNLSGLLSNLTVGTEEFRKFPGWVRLILIRKVTDIAAIGIEDKNEPKRFEKAFKGVPSEAWQLFETPDECQAIIERVVGGK
ncbi:uncharacterized protein BP5553_06407 [Venustampulla echinocandica]|uniref:Phosphatidate phosphatase APP1 catalytic domain-containing protein n=1 Tax=Venustampulla echinocandica TaxID=2656787 RepID=A0A370TJU9_9HELO|nr:uncharacterized protein BP5553_06407 [Venustampulla echinocandica]RDL35795.1 hypothetical protein BP5553_06407 [Venustampulla echinocandica]